MPPDDLRSLIGVFVEANSFQHAAGEELGRIFDAKALFRLVNCVVDEPFDIDYYVEVTDKQSVAFARDLERDGVRVHSTDLRDPLVQAYGVKSEEVLEQEARTALSALKTLVVVCGRRDQLRPFVHLFAAAKKRGCRTVLLCFSGKIPRKLGGVADLVVNIPGVWAERKRPTPFPVPERRSGVNARSTGMNIKEVRGHVDFGIITVKEEEQHAILRQFAGAAKVDGGQELYHFVTVPTVDGRDQGVAIIRCMEQGPGEAQMVASHFIQDLHPRWLLLVGIAGGAPDTAYSLGDVMLASRIHDFSVTAALQGKPPELNIDGGRVHPDVARLLRYLPGCAELTGWNASEGEGAGDESPPVGPPGALLPKKPRLRVPQRLQAKAYYGPQSLREKVRDSLQKNASRLPVYKVGPVGTSGALVKSASLLASWKKAARSITHVEMEMGGVDQAVWPANVPLLGIRGLSDVVGFKRGDEWTGFACHTAAAFAYALVRSGLVTAHPPATSHRRRDRWDQHTGDYLIDRGLEQLNDYEAPGGGIPNKAKVGDMGIDGGIYPVSSVGKMPAEKPKKKGKDSQPEFFEDFMDVWYPVQVKQKDKADRPDIDKFEAVMMRENRTKGFFVSFEFTSGALAEIGAFFKRSHKAIIALTVREILDEEIAMKLA
jgi:nucleoside phosphorylase